MDPVAAFLDRLHTTFTAWALPLTIVTLCWVGIMLCVKAMAPGFTDRHSGGFWIALFGPILIGWAPILAPWLIAFH